MAIEFSESIKSVIMGNKNINDTFLENLSNSFKEIQLNFNSIHKMIESHLERDHQSFVGMLNSEMILGEKLKEQEEMIQELRGNNEELSNENEKNKKLIKDLSEQMGEIKRKIILSEDNANRSGRPALSDEDIAFIRELREQGHSQRKVAEMVGVGNGTVAKYDKLSKEDNSRGKISNGF